MGERNRGCALSDQEAEPKGKPYLESEAGLGGNKDAEANGKAGQEDVLEREPETSGGLPAAGGG